MPYCLAQSATLTPSLTFLNISSFISIAIGGYFGIVFWVKLKPTKLKKECPVFGVPATQWSLYHDDELSFEIRYPKDWKVERWYNGKFGIVIDFTGPLHKEKFSGKTLEVQDTFSIDVADQDDVKIKSIKQWVNKYHLSPNDKNAKNYHFENF